MDSLTQAVLGAACGEAILGRKIGNKAILWGAMAGTISDLDVLSKIFISNPVYELIYHRGFTHSIFFTLLAPFLLAYFSRKYKYELISFFWFLILLFLVFLDIDQYNLLRYIFSFSSVGLYVYFILVNFKKRRQPWELEPSFKDWYWFYLICIFTHWLIDAFTSYGTQILEPFSSYRFSMNNMPIVDPLYTLPLLITVILIYFFIKNNKLRMLVNYTGILLSSLYVVFSFYAKNNANYYIEENLKNQSIPYVEYISYPTIFNTLFWQTTIKTEDAFYYGTYSVLDRDKKIKFTKLPVNHQLLIPYENHPEVKILIWFAQGYYNVTETKEGYLQINNLRFGLQFFNLFPDLQEDPYIFRYQIIKKGAKINTKPIYPELNSTNFREGLRRLWTRIWGN